MLYSSISVISYKFLRVKCGNRQVSKNVLEELPDTMAADVDTFRGPQIRTNIGPARIGMNGLYQSVEITIFECPQHSLHDCYRIVRTH